jgi:uncharacterized membrane-anchored protein
VSDKYLVPVFDVTTLACETVAVAASCEAAAVWAVLRNSAQLRYTGGVIERIELNEETNVTRDIWHERWRPARLREKV